MDKPARRYWVNVNVVAGTMASTLIVVLAVGATLGIAGILAGVALWFGYFAVGWVLDAFQARMIKRYEEGLPESRPPRDHSDRTYEFLLWPISLMFTGIYVPLVLLLRRMFRADPS